MEKKKIELIRIELDLAKESYDSAEDDRKANRYRRATSGLYLAMEHLAKALLLTVGIEVESHGGVARMLGLHFVKPGVLSPRVTRHLGNLYERRHIAEYSSRAAWEFSGEEIDTYLEWVRFSGGEILRQVAEVAPELQESIKKLQSSFARTD
jgi:uncharacterized protein (UPF0332 family)